MKREPPNGKENNNIRLIVIFTLFKHRNFLTTVDCENLGFYDLSKEEREKLVKEIRQALEHDLRSVISKSILKYAAVSDIYTWKNIYNILGCLYRDRKDIIESILSILNALFANKTKK